MKSTALALRGSRKRVEFSVWVSVELGLGRESEGWNRRLWGERRLELRARQQRDPEGRVRAGQETEAILHLEDFGPKPWHVRGETRKRECLEVWDVSASGVGNCVLCSQTHVHKTLTCSPCSVVWVPRGSEDILPAFTWI